MKTSVGLILAVILAASQPDKDKRAISILGRDNRSENGQKGWVMMPHVAPVIYVNQVSGDPLPEKGSILCSWKEERDADGPIVVGYCEGNAKVILSGIDLNY